MKFFYLRCFIILILIENKMTWKTVSIFSYIWLWVVFQYLGISEEMCVILWVLILLDFCLWIAEARKNEIPITSKKMKEWIVGKILIFIIPFIVAIVFRWIGREGVSEYFVSIIISTLIVSEGYSAIGHIYNFKTGKHFPENDAVSQLLHKIWELFKKKLDEKPE